MSTKTEEITETQGAAEVEEDRPAEDQDSKDDSVEAESPNTDEQKRVEEESPDTDEQKGAEEESPDPTEQSDAGQESPETVPSDAEEGAVEDQGPSRDSESTGSEGPSGSEGTEEPTPGGGEGEPTDVRRVEFQPVSAHGAAAPGDNIHLLMDVTVPVAIELGSTQMSLREVLKLGPGSLVKLERAVGDPVDILVNGELVGRGEVVVVGDQFGIRVTELLSPDVSALA